jgi:hypothetical protein
MGIPLAVQAQIDEANRIQQTLHAPAEQPAPQDPPENDTTPDSEPAAPVAPEPESEPEVDWEHKYRSEIGRFKAETDRAREAMQTAWEQAAQLKQEIETLRQQVAQPAPTPEPEVRLSGVTDDDVETFGSDMVEFAKRAAASAIQPMLKVFDAKLNGMQQAIETVRQQVGAAETQYKQTAEQAYLEKLGQLVPDWREIDADPAFGAWLREEEGYTGYPRQEFFSQAHQQLNAVQVARIFNAYRGLQTPARPSQSAELKKQVSPSKSRNAATPPGKSTKVWTIAEIQKFYEQVAFNRIPADEAARIEAEINLAAAEGRVR